MLLYITGLPLSSVALGLFIVVFHYDTVYEFMDVQFCSLLKIIRRAVVLKTAKRSIYSTVDIKRFTLNAFESKRSCINVLQNCSITSQKNMNQIF